MRKLKRHIKIGMMALLAVMCIYLLYLMTTIEFDNRFAYVVYADGKIVNAQVSEDEQWRIKCDSEVPDKLKICLKLFEDQYFDYHLGVNPVSLVDAIYQNIKHKEIVKGGSTITMQVARIHEGNQSRTYVQKLKEIMLAIAMELRYSKKSILKFYAQYAPYGGNTVGFCAASLRYYDKDASELSWSEAATLAVLPNAPSQIYPGKAQEELIRKRNFLLDKLLAQELMDTISCRLAKLEPLPVQSHYFESITPHLLQEFKAENPDGFNYYTTLDYTLQKNVKKILDNYRARYHSIDDIKNVAAIILRKDGSTAAYIGNSGCRVSCGADVDILSSMRSPGSTLKPFLYGLAIDEGMITPQSLLKDIPVFYNGYAPGNFDKKFRGIVKAERALTESLNIPAIDLLSDYGVSPFLNDLKELQFTGLNKSADHYGLSLILGGAEVRGRDLATAYLNLQRNNEEQNPVSLRFLNEESIEIDNKFPLSIASSYQVSEMLKGVNRPSNQDGWKYFEGGKEISWKTGTSYGMRDAWAVGSSSEYTVLVWVGNADGEGKPGLTGVVKAGPILFEVFDLLPAGKESEIALSHFTSKKICAESGYTASSACLNTSEQLVPAQVGRIPICDFHQFITMDTSGQFRVYEHCESNNITAPMMVLEPKVNRYYHKHTGHSLSLPPYAEDCITAKEKLQILYPTKGAELLLPQDFDETKQQLVSEVLVDNSVDSIFWFVDNELLNVTKANHKIELDLEPGEHTLTVVSSQGEEDSRSFTILR